MTYQETSPHGFVVICERDFYQEPCWMTRAGFLRSSPIDKSAMTVEVANPGYGVTSHEFDCNQCPVRCRVSLDPNRQPNLRIEKIK